MSTPSYEKIPYNAAQSPLLSADELYAQNYSSCVQDCVDSGVETVATTDLCAYTVLDSRLFPDMVTLYRIDQKDRVSQGIRTARTILADGAPVDFYFDGDDVAHHLGSNYHTRLQRRPRHASPFVSAALNTRSPLFRPRKTPDTSDGGTYLYALSVMRSRVIVPEALIDGSEPDFPQSQLGAQEVLIRGDIAVEDMTTFGPLTQDLVREFQFPDYKRSA